MRFLHKYVIANLFARFSSKTKLSFLITFQLITSCINFINFAASTQSTLRVPYNSLITFCTFQYFIILIWVYFLIVFVYFSVSHLTSFSKVLYSFILLCYFFRFTRNLLLIRSLSFMLFQLIFIFYFSSEFLLSLLSHFNFSRAHSSLRLIFPPSLIFAG